MIGQLDKKILLSEDVPVGGCGLEGLGGLSLAQGHIDLSLQAAAQGNETLTVLGQEFAIDAGLVVEAFEVGRCAELHQVPVTGVIGCEERHVEGYILASIACLLFVHRPWRDIDLAADDGLYLSLLGRLIELHCPEEIPVVRQGDCRHF